MPAGERLNVFLTNALEEAHESTAGALFAHEIAHEAAGADAVKREKPVMVVLGNPPYSGHSANKGHWIKGLLRGWDGTQGPTAISRSASAAGRTQFQMAQRRLRQIHPLCPMAH